MVARKTKLEKIKELKEKKKAIILVHNYQPAEIQEIADFTGDSLGLSIQAATTKAKIIVFCGVYFMAETAKILSPQKTVLIPDITAGCPMADMINLRDVQSLRKRYPGSKIVCYVNTHAEVKAESDICCTSANATKIVRQLINQDNKVIFIPDRYLSKYIENQIKKKLVSWHGYCPVHIKIKAKDILREKKNHPLAEILVHPECKPSVIKLADKVLSTEGICEHTKKSRKREFIIATEVGILYRLQKENPEKIFYPANKEAICRDMKKNTLEKVLQCLENMQYEIILPERIIKKAQVSIRRMLECANKDD